MHIPRYTYIMRDQVQDKVGSLMRTDARGRRRRRRWVALGRVVVSVVSLGRH